MSLIARHLEANGIPTVVIGTARDIVEKLMPGALDAAELAELNAAPGLSLAERIPTLLDILDGRLARATNQQSKAGAFLDEAMGIARQLQQSQRLGPEVIGREIMDPGIYE